MTLHDEHITPAPWSPPTPTRPAATLVYASLEEELGGDDRLVPVDVLELPLLPGAIPTGDVDLEDPQFALPSYRLVASYSTPDEADEPF